MRPVMAVIAAALALLAWGARESAAGRPAWQAALSESLSADYRTAVVDVIFTNDLVATGTVVVVRKDGLAGVPLSLADTDNIVRVGSGGRGPAAALDVETTGALAFKVGSRHYVRKVRVKVDEVQLSTVTADAYDRLDHGKVVPRYYQAVTHFVFAAGQLDTMSCAGVRAAIAAVLTREQDLPPVKTILTGQTRQQVEAALGLPDSVVVSESRQTCVYPRLRVILRDGRVSDVE